MTNHYLLAMLAGERYRELRAAADRRRSAMRARAPRRRRWNLARPGTGDGRTLRARPVLPDLLRRAARLRAARPVRLPSGFDIVVRPVRRDDGPLLVEGFGRLSSETRRLRFLGGKSRLTASDVRHLTEIDHHDHEALAALDRDGRGVAVARYVRERENPHLAETAIVVVDEWHRRGVGRYLVGRLAQRAADEGIRCFTGMMAEDNVAVVALLASLGARVATTRAAGGVTHFVVPVASLLPEPARSHGPALESPCLA